MRGRLVLLAALLAVLLAAGCGSGETVAPLPETVEGTIAQETEPGDGDGLPEGDPEAGGEVFASAGCGSCHTFEPAGTESDVGPNLSESLQGADRAFIHESIVDPNAEVAEGFQPGIMPGNYEEQLSEEELADLVAFLEQAS